MARDSDDAGGGAREGAAPRRDPFPPEADTLSAHGELVQRVRRDTTPAPPIGAAPADVELLVDDACLYGAIDDDTQVLAEVVADDPTSPTLALANRSQAAREVYRLFLASEYAPALALANDLIAQGDDDPMLVTIARECRSSLDAPRPAPLPPPSAPPSGRFRALPPRAALAPPTRPDRSPPATGFDGKMTIEQIASMTGTPVERVLGLLERFVAMGVLPPPRPGDRRPP